TTKNGRNVPNFDLSERYRFNAVGGKYVNLATLSKGDRWLVIITSDNLLRVIDVNRTQPITNADGPEIPFLQGLSSNRGNVLASRGDIISSWRSNGRALVNNWTLDVRPTFIEAFSTKNKAFYLSLADQGYVFATEIKSDKEMWRADIRCK